MTRAEIEGYLLHAKASPETFVLDEQANLLEADIATAVEKALAEDRAKDGPLLSCPVCFAVLSGCIAHRQIGHLIECADKLDKAWRERHAREIERARGALRDIQPALNFLAMHYEPGPQGHTPNIFAWEITDTAIKGMRAALAALDTKADAAPTEER